MLSWCLGTGPLSSAQVLKLVSKWNVEVDARRCKVLRRIVAALLTSVGIDADRDAFDIVIELEHHLALVSELNINRRVEVLAPGRSRGTTSNRAGSVLSRYAFFEQGSNFFRGMVW